MASLDYTRYFSRLENYRQRHNNNAKRYAISSKKEIEEQLQETSQLYKRWLESKKNGSKNRNGYSKNKKIVAKASFKKLNPKFPLDNISSSEILNKTIEDLKDTSMGEECLEIQYDDEFWHEVSRNREFSKDILEQLDESEAIIPPLADLAAQPFVDKTESKISLNNTRQVLQNQEFEISSKNLNYLNQLPAYELLSQSKTEIINYDKTDRLPTNNYLQHQHLSTNANMQYKTQHQAISNNQYFSDVHYVDGGHGIRKIYNEANLMCSHNQNINSAYYNTSPENMLDVNMFTRTARTDAIIWPSNQFNHITNYPQQGIHMQISNALDVQSQILNHNYLNHNGYYSVNSKPLEGNQFVKGNEILRLKNNIQDVNSASLNIHIQDNIHSLHNSQICNWELYDKESFLH